MSVWSEAEMESTDRFWKWGWCLRYPSHVSLMACRSSWWCRADKTPTNTSCTAFWLSVNTILNRNDIISTNTEPNDITHAANHSNMQKAFLKDEHLLKINLFSLRPSAFLHQIWRNVVLHQCLSSEWVPSEWESMDALQWMGAVRMRVWLKHHEDVFNFNLLLLAKIWIHNP